MHPSLGPFVPTKTANNNTLLTRIIFHNSKSNRIGKQSVSLVLVEALYATRSLEYLVSSRITRANSTGSTMTSQPKTGPQQQLLETSYAQSKQTGPTLVFRFYCRGENDTNSYKESLKSTLNEALLLFLSDYLTKIDPELYLKRIRLRRKPASFRVSYGEALAANQCESPDNIDNTFKANRKRHKSMGNEKLLNRETSLKDMSSSFQTGYEWLN